jgi:hypothetical protein
MPSFLAVQGGTMPKLTEVYRGYTIHIPYRRSVPGAPFEAKLGRDVGLAYVAGGIDAYLREKED